MTTPPRLALGLLLAVLSPPARAAPPVALTVEVAQLPAASGEVECVLWSGPDGFPASPERALQRQRVKVEPGGVAHCHFEVAAGTWAVTMIHDANGNGRLDTGFLGIPTEAYGYSRDPRPLMRAPRFEEAGFAVGEQPLIIRITPV